MSYPLFFFCCFFFLGGEDVLAQPLRFNALHLPSMNKTSSYEFKDVPLSKIWPLHNEPAIAGMVNGTSLLGYAYLGFVNVSEDAYVLSVVITDSSVVGFSSYPIYYFMSSYGYIVWMANRNKPATGGIPRLQVEPPLNNLVLRGGDGEEVWRAYVNASSIELQGNGNFLIYDNANTVVWQSYDHPTDTFVMGQILRKGDRLVSRSSTDLSEGPYSMEILSHGIAMYYNHSSFIHPYYSTKFDCSHDTEIVFLDFSFEIRCKLFEGFGNADTILFAEGDSSIPVLRLQSTGDLAILQILGFSRASASPFSSTLCLLPMKCGAYTTCDPSSGFCTNECTTDSGEDCRPPGNASTHSLLATCSSNNPVGQAFKMEKLSGILYSPSQYGDSINVTSSEECKDLCASNCTCVASFFNHSASSGEDNLCFLEEDVLHFTKSPDKDNVGFIKMAVANPPPDQTPTPSRRKVLLLVIGLPLFFLLVCIGVGGSLYMIKRRNGLNIAAEFEFESENDVSNSDFLQALQASLPTRFSYKEIQSITNNFAKKLGSGGFGSVFEGLSLDGNKVAVKRLDGVSGQGEKEFRAEVVVLANIHHLNLVKLLGFCGQGSQRLLVYEHMINGSLDTWLFGNLTLTWETRHQIAVGVASGLAYLHEECHSKVIHLDIKPQNVLLDENFVAKVGDFGMSRLMKREESSALTTMRGTPGYLAPEWLLNGVANEKMDVYSFGMLLLELISGRKNYDMQVMEEDKCYFPAWALNEVREGRELQILDCKLHNSLQNDGEVKQIRTMINVCYLCNQEDPRCRPRMSTVVKMLEGETGVPSLPLSQQLNSMHTRIAKSAKVNSFSIEDISSIALEGK